MQYGDDNPLWINIEKRMLVDTLVNGWLVLFVSRSSKDYLKLSETVLERMIGSLLVDDDFGIRSIELIGCRCTQEAVESLAVCHAIMPSSKAWNARSPT
jgi:hypothetical protein